MFNGFHFPFVFRRRDPAPPPDVVAFMEHVRRAKIDEEVYTERERLADFKLTFQSHPANERVLYQIMHWGGLFDTSPDTIAPDGLQRREGRRELAAAIMAALNAEAPAMIGPPQLPTEEPETGEDNG